MRFSSFFRSQLLVFLFLCGYYAYGQKDLVFTHADTLRGMLSDERSCYKVVFYDLHLSIHLNRKLIEGYNVIYFKPVRNFTTMQIDLYKNMSIYKIDHHGDSLNYWRDSNAVFIYF